MELVKIVLHRSALSTASKEKKAKEKSRSFTYLWVLSCSYSVNAVSFASRVNFVMTKKTLQ